MYRRHRGWSSSSEAKAACCSAGLHGGAPLRGRGATPAQRVRHVDDRCRFDFAKQGRMFSASGTRRRGGLRRSVAEETGARLAHPSNPSQHISELSKKRGSKKRELTAHCCSAMLPLTVTVLTTLRPIERCDRENAGHSRQTLWPSAVHGDRRRHSHHLPALSRGMRVARLCRSPRRERRRMRSSGSLYASSWNGPPPLAT